MIGIHQRKQGRYDPEDDGALYFVLKGFSEAIRLLETGVLNSIGL
jgi:hypothetical protein